MLNIPPPQQVRQIDANLTYVKSFHPASAGVYLVRTGNEHFILKVADKRKRQLEPDYFRQFRLKHLSVEEKVLNELAKVEGITHLVRAYDSQNYVALLKEFYEGFPVNLLTSLADYCALKEKIKEIHSHKIAGIDVRRSNLIKNPDQYNQPPVIVDLGTGIFMKDVPLKEFTKRKKEDLARLDSIFSP